MAGYPWYVIVFFHPLLAASSLYLFKELWTVSVMPFALTTLIFSDTWSVQTAAFFSGLSLIPLLLMVLVLMLARVFTSAGNVLRKKNSLFFEVTQQTLRNTLEQNFLFVVSLAGASSFYVLTIERMLFLTGMYIGSRLLFWCTYLLSAYTNWIVIRGVPFWFTFLNNILLLVYTLSIAYVSVS